MLHYIKYGEREHIERFFEDGSVQIGTLRSYDEALYGSMIGDDDEGTSVEVVTDANAHLLVPGENVSPQIDMGNMFGPGGSGNILIRKNVSFNYAIFCVSRCLHKVLCKNFSDKYDAAFYIDRPFPFFHELSKSFEESLSPQAVQFQHIADVEYRRRSIDVGTQVLEVFTKPEDYRHQFETRAIWNLGKPKERFYRFKAPGAVRCCRKILLDDMPDYQPGASAEEVDQAVRKALRI